jgi:hypothetical protein
MENLNLKGGALIIGSLLWQDDLKVEDKDGIRKKWRDSCLEEESIRIKAPIRYGRLSGGGIYTMVLSKSCEEESKAGIGYVKVLNKYPFNSWGDIESQVIEMSKAEGMNGKFIAGKPVWCTMSILFNSDRIDEGKRDFIIGKWIEKVEADGGGGDLVEYKFGDEESALKSDCTLNFNWFSTVDERHVMELSSLDFIICTATKQKSTNSSTYPSIKEIAESVKKDIKREYFKNNVKHGISTFEDELIRKESGEEEHKSISDKILEDFYEKIQENENFDDSLVSKLKILGKTDKLSHQKSIEEIIIPK